ncbi:hypothetical protein QTG54_005079 [Skeletonema marinoi]|uniref:2',3'-cyclic-nucleotide 3'-phosphodiesterase n=1 Tax=Skeletonema marinoi TaxID=267567 RepID=A0AAD8YDK4_9STRA|nr:hypothetical protein QTG54_005079 [Skeletonema marinoi]
MTSKFSFKFSGFSVWLEPDPDQSSQMISEMEYLRTKCGGSEAGQHTFVPHCTLLYNTSLDANDGEQADGGDGSSCDDQTKQQQGEYMLRQCLEEYHKQTADTTCNDGNHQKQKPNDTKQLQLIPTSQYYFPYPKTADNGKGFGCCISLLILDTTPQLKLLHDIVRNRFPPDERHGDSSDNDCDNSNGEAEEPRFRPHMALIYAPEDQENVTNGWLEKYTKQNEEEKRYEKWIPAKQKDQTIDDDGKEGAVGWNAKYLSLWSTEGILDEWYPIFKLDLEATL